MNRSRDLHRLSHVASQLPDEAAKAFRQAVDQAAGTLVVLGVLKLTLITKAGEGDAVSIVAMLSDWLSHSFPAALPNGSKLGNRKKDSRTDPARLNAFARDLLAIDDAGQWRAIDEEAVAYMTQLKLYAKASEIDNG
jgi:hypothetical protein